VFIGFACGKLKAIPESGLAWMSFFVFYIALPPLFYRILATTPLEQLNRLGFVFATTLSTYIAFALSFVAAVALRSRLTEATIAGLAGGYGNIGYMGPGLAFSTLGAQAAAPVALIFCFDHLLLFSLVPLLMALAGTERKGALATAREVVKRIVTHPLMVASALGALSAALRFEPPVALDKLLQLLQSAAAPSALFTLGVTVALRPLEKMPWEVPLLVAIKLIAHPAIVLGMLLLLGPFDPLWMAAAVLMAALPPALNVFVFARQYESWVPQASSAVMIGTLVSVLTLTSVMWLVKTQNLPGLAP
jgi:predicted permease